MGSQHVEGMPSDEFVLVLPAGAEQMNYVEPRYINDFYARAISTKFVAVWLRATDEAWELIKRPRSDAEKPPKQASLVGVFTTDTSAKDFAADVDATAADIVKRAA